MFDDVIRINAGKLRRYPLTVKTTVLNARDLIRVFIGIFQSLRIINKIKPDVFFSKGGFVALPAGIAAHLRGIPIITHDSDSVPGITNRLLGKWAVVNATGMPTEFYRYPKARTNYVGIPVDERLYSPISKAKATDCLNKYDIPEPNEILLVMGGSLGADSINHTLPVIASQLLTQHPKLYIIHIAGKKHQVLTQGEYRHSLGKDEAARVKVISFSDELYVLETLASLVITRAGASSMAELAILAKPCVVVPSPFLSGDHQLKNAEWYAKSRAVSIINNSSPPEQWLRVISELLDSELERKRLATELHKLAKPKATEELAGFIIEQANIRSAR